MKRTLTVLHMITGLCMLWLTPGYAQDDWTLQNPETSPPKLAVHGMASLGDDKVLVFGGFDGTWDGASLVTYGETWVYDLGENNWTLKNPATSPQGRAHHALASIGGDKVLLYGGDVTYEPTTTVNDTWVYDLSDNTWTLMNPATDPGPREVHAMASLGGDQVLLFGGGGLTSNETWVYDLSNNTWTQKNPSTHPLMFTYGDVMASIGDDKVLLFSGLLNMTGETWVYDLSDDTWTQKNPTSPPMTRIYQTIASLGCDRVLLFGGLDPQVGDSDESWIYDLSDDTWTLMNPVLKPLPRELLTMASIGTGHVLLFGGYGNPYSENFLFDDTWLYTTTTEGSCTNPTVSAGADEQLYFGYGPGQCKTKTAVVTEGTAPFSYSWSLDRDLLLNVINESGDETMTGINTASVTICLLDTAELCVTITDANGNTASDCALIFGEDVRCFSGNNEKVNVCHNGNTICIDENALDAHLDHGDYVGTCNPNLVTPDVVDGDSYDIAGHLPEFSIYPNPNNGDFRILFDHTGYGIINIIDRNGQVVRSIDIDKCQQLDINLIESGVYFIQLITDQQMLTKKLTVVR